MNKRKVESSLYRNFCNVPNITTLCVVFNSEDVRRVRTGRERFADALFCKSAEGAEKMFLSFLKLMQAFLQPHS